MSSQGRHRYDLMNDHDVVRRCTAVKDPACRQGAPAAPSAFRDLDVAGGTGDVAFESPRRGPADRRNGLDVNADHAGVGRGAPPAQAAGQLAFVEGNAEGVPLPPDSLFRPIRSPLAFRQRARIDKALAEAIGAEAGAGVFLALEFSRGSIPPLLGPPLSTPIVTAIPAIGQRPHRRWRALCYLVRIDSPLFRRRSFSPTRSATRLCARRLFRLSGGVVAIHSGWKT